MQASRAFCHAGYRFLAVLLLVGALLALPGRRRRDGLI